MYISRMKPITGDVIKFHDIRHMGKESLYEREGQVTQVDYTKKCAWVRTMNKNPHASEVNKYFSLRVRFADITQIVI